MEVIGTNQPGGGEAVTLQSGEATIVAQINWGQRRSFLRFVLGFSYADPGAPWALHRENPQYHPEFTWLSATSVSFSAMAPKANDASTGTFVPGSFSDSLPQAQYKICYAVVRFTDQPYTFLEDSDILTSADEAYRNTFFNPTPSVEIISAEGLNQVKFTAGPQGGEPIPAPFGTLMSKCTLSFKWMNVPNEYISGPNTLTFTPKWINSVVGRVNSVAFLGYPAGTLLLQAPQYERCRFPEQTSDGVYGYFGWNITFPIQFFDPSRGYSTATLTTRVTDTSGILTLVSNTVGIDTGQNLDLVWAGGGLTGTTLLAYTTKVVTGKTYVNTISFSGGTGTLPIAGTSIQIYNNAYRGNQLVPSRIDNLWYGCIRENGTAKLYPEADFYNLFKHVGQFV